MFVKFAVRDLLIVAVALLVWWLAAGQSGGTGAVSDFTGFVAGLLLGASGFVLHEWGHLLAAFASRSAVRPSHNLGTPFIFSFSARRNSLAQFLTMSVGGFVVTAAIVWAYYVYLPDGLLASRIARGGALFLAFLGVTLELPLVGVALYRRAVPAQVAVKVAGPPARSAA